MFPSCLDTLCSYHFHWSVWRPEFSHPLAVGDTGYFCQSVCRVQSTHLRPLSSQFQIPDEAIHVLVHLIQYDHQGFVHVTWSESEGLQGRCAVQSTRHGTPA
uniref:Uncharacterized protein n=1 Tax=Cacopsylla melanoneura TaxID=428564 RepID=A0A8D8Q7E6_9HEMI